MTNNSVYNLKRHILDCFSFVLLNQFSMFTAMIVFLFKVLPQGLSGSREMSKKSESWSRRKW